MICTEYISWRCSQYGKYLLYVKTKFFSRLLRNICTGLLFVSSWIACSVTIVRYGFPVISIFSMLSCSGCPNAFLLFQDFQPPSWGGSSWGGAGTPPRGVPPPCPPPPFGRGGGGPPQGRYDGGNWIPSGPPPSHATSGFGVPPPIAG